jgi:transcriptional regulator with XRE-family HTH domain
MYNIDEVHRLLQEARVRAGLTQRELAKRVGTSQPAIAKLEQGTTNPTIDTLTRCLAATGFTLRVGLAPLRADDPVVERYKQDVDRSLLRENLRKPVDDRIRTLSEWQQAGAELQRAMREARKRR